MASYCSSSFLRCKLIHFCIGSLKWYSGSGTSPFQLSWKDNHSSTLSFQLNQNPMCSNVLNCDVPALSFVSPRYPSSTLTVVESLSQDLFPHIYIFPWNCSWTWCAWIPPTFGCLQTGKLNYSQQFLFSLLSASFPKAFWVDGLMCPSFTLNPIPCHIPAGVFFAPLPILSQPCIYFSKLHCFGC